MGAPQPTVSVIVHRSRVLDQHHAYVRIGEVDAGYRDLDNGQVHCGDAALRAIVAEATAPLMITSVATSPTAELYRCALATNRTAALSA